MLMRVRLITLLVCVGLVGPSLAADRYLPGRVVRVIDGDSLMLDVGGARYRVELAAIDAPELNQPWGAAAATALHDTLTGAFVAVRTRGAATPLTGQILFRGRDVALDLVHDGLAWAMPAAANDPAAAPLQAAEQRARDARRGLWADPAPIAPWDWRTTPDR